MALSRRNFLSGIAAAAGAGPLASLSRAIGGRDSAKAAAARTKARELSADVLVVGGSFGGVAAALAAARMGCRVVLSEQTGWIGGQATTQAVPLDEHPWIESFGRNRSYAEFRRRVRDYYRRNFPLTSAARGDPALNPGAGWVSALCFEPRIGITALHEMLAPYMSAGLVTVLLRHRPVGATMEGDRCQAVTLLDEEAGSTRTVSATLVLDGTDLGELLPLAGVEHVVGAESRAETGEPNALEGPAEPGLQQPFNHVFAVDYLPGDDHVIEPPRDYAFWRRQMDPGTGRLHIAVPDLFALERDFFRKKPVAGRYVFSLWAFRRLLCRGNFAPGAFRSDTTVAVWGQNSYGYGVLNGVPEAEARRHLEAARQLSLSVIYWLQTEAPNGLEHRTGFPGLRPRGDVLGTDNGLAQYPYIRESRRIRAEFTVLEQHFRMDLPATRNGPVKYPDTAGVGGYRIDIHREAKSGRSLTQENNGKHWTQQIPLGALIPIRVENVLPACKNLGVTAVTNGAFRIHATEWGVGEAAGALAGFCVRRKLAPRQVRNTARHLTDFQREIVRQGFELDWPGPTVAASYNSYHYYDDPLQPDWYYGEAWRLKGPRAPAGD